VESNAEKARAIIEARKRADPLAWYVPSPTQDEFLRRDTVKHPFILVGSLNRGGKSAVTMADLAMTLRGIHPHRPNYRNLTIAVFAPTRMQAANVIARKLFDDSELLLPEGTPPEARNQPMIPSWEIARLSRPMQAGMRVPKEVVLRNGNRAIFSWTGADDQDAKISGLKLDAAYIDEEAGTPRLFAEIASRLTDALSDANRPGLGYYVWAYTNTRYNEAYENFKTRSEDQVAGHRTYIIRPGENPAITAQARTMLGGTMDADQAKIRMEGGADAGSLVQIYGKQWQDERHILKEPYQIGELDNLWVSYDPGVEHPMGMLVAAINQEYPLRLNCVQAWTYKGETIEKDVDNLYNWLRGRKITGFVYDTNLKNRDRGGGPTVLTRMKEIMASRGIVPICGFHQSKKNHAPGIAIVRHYLDPEDQRQETPPLIVLDKMNDTNGMAMMRAQLLKYRGKESTKFTGPGGVVKKDDELCLSGDTLILLADGSERRLDEMAIGDMVQTPIGPRRVTSAGMTGIKCVVELKRANSSRPLVATGNHPILTGRGMGRIDSIRYDDILATCEHIPAQTPSNATANAGSPSARNNATTAIGGATSCIGIFGRKRSGLSQKVIISTIRMATTRITTLRIWLASLAAITSACTWTISRDPTLNGARGSQMQPVKPLPSGMALMMAMCSISGWGSVLRNCAQYLTVYANNVASIIRSGVIHAPAFVSALITANQRPAVSAAWMMRTAHASSVTPSFALTNTAGSRLAPSLVAGVRSLGPREVYNLTVDEAHCFIANGVVCSNCDTLRYLAMQRPYWHRDWACGPALGIPTQRVAFLDATGTIPVTDNKESPVPVPRYDWEKGIIRSRDRRARAGYAWREMDF